MQQRIRPNLWFDTEAEEAAGFYGAVFPNSRVVSTAHYTEAGPREAGMVMTVEFDLDGQRFMGINGGPEFKFDEAVSSRSTARTRTKSTTTGSASPPTAARRACAAGSRTASGSPGRSSRPA